MAFKPLIGVTACVKQIGLHPYHISGDKYLRAVSVAALGLPVVIPSLGDLTDIEDLLAQLDKASKGKTLFRRLESQA